MNRLSRKSVSLALVVCLLAPALSVAQPTPGAPPPGVPQTGPTPPTPRTPGAFAPLAPGRGDLYLGQQARSIAGPDYRLGPGDVGFIGSNEMHNAKNVGTSRAEYFIVNIGRDDV